MTSKDQERKALEQIRKIIEGLGENSYIGMAFEGVLEDAADNIENDFGNSWKARAEHAQKDAEEFKRAGEYYAQEAERYQKEVEAVKSELELAKDTLHRECERANGWIKKYNEVTEASNELTEKIESMQLVVMELKAKLYDLLMTEK